MFSDFAVIVQILKNKRAIILMAQCSFKINLFVEIRMALESLFYKDGEEQQQGNQS